MTSFGNPPLAQVNVSQTIQNELSTIRTAGEKGRDEMIKYLDRSAGMTSNDRNDRLRAIFNDPSLCDFITKQVEFESKGTPWSLRLFDRSDKDRPVTAALGLLALKDGTSPENIKSILIAFDSQETKLPKAVLDQYNQICENTSGKVNPETGLMAKPPGYMNKTIKLSEFRDALRELSKID